MSAKEQPVAVDLELAKRRNCVAWKCVSHTTVTFTANHLFTALEVYKNKPNVVNKQSCGAEILFDRNFVASDFCRNETEFMSTISECCSSANNLLTLPVNFISEITEQFLFLPIDSECLRFAKVKRVVVRRVLPKSFARNRPMHETLVFCETLTSAQISEQLIFIVPFRLEADYNQSQCNPCSHCSALCFAFQPASTHFSEAANGGKLDLYLYSNDADTKICEDDDVNFADEDECSDESLASSKRIIMVNGDKFSWLYEKLCQFIIKVSSQRHAAEVENLREQPKKSKRELLRQRQRIVANHDDDDHCDVTDDASDTSLAAEEDKTSLRLIDLASYQRTYEMLKLKHWRSLLDNWTERTDPDKFVAEDLGIAAYLMCLWGYGIKDENNNQTPRKSLSWVDVGCGNGLLVYILACEGFESTGIDLRRRPRIWHQFERQNIPTLHLIERSIEPTSVPDVEYFSQFDWLIGNHSDELTVWIPTLAALNNKNCMVLPCCAFDFTCKYQKKPLPNSDGVRSFSNSLYHSFLDYVEYVCQQLCFHRVDADYLRIPSTKRKCFVCIQSPTVTATTMVDQRRQQLEFLSKCGVTFSESRSADATKTGETSKGIMKRDIVEPVRNCTRVDKNLQARIVAAVFEFLLNAENAVGKKNNWNAGGRLHIRTIAERLLSSQSPLLLASEKNDAVDPGDNSAALKQLKSQCGGLLTLLKNHSFIFVIESGGFVRLRNYADERDSVINRRRQQQRDRKSGKTKPSAANSGDAGSSLNAENCDIVGKSGQTGSHTKVDRFCYFAAYHPDGCPASEGNCRYSHKKPPALSIENHMPIIIR